MSSINTCAVSGKLTRDPEVKSLPSGLSVIEFGVAVNKSKKTDDGGYEEEVSFVDVTVFGNFADLLGRKLRKADTVSVQGELKQDRWEAQDGSNRSKLKIIGRQVDSPALYKKDEEIAPSEAAQATIPETAPAVADDDIPF